MEARAINDTGFHIKHILLPGYKLTGWVLTLLLFILLFQTYKSFTGIREPQTSTLVLYTFSATDPEYLRNLEFFVAHGIHKNDGCEYYIIVQGHGRGQHLPEVPINAQYVYHKNACYDWGTFGWALRTLELEMDLYKYIIFLNSSVRGPFLPPFWPGNLHWSRVFTDKLNDKVKLVGSTISCEPVRKGGNPAGVLRHNAHVQSYAMATDQAGLKILLNDRHVFECHKSIADAVYNAEAGASLAMFKAGYSIDSLMMRYQSVDWTDERFWDCNARLNPYAEFAYDGIGLNPMEVLFVKIKSFQKETDWATTVMAITYDRWIASMATVNLTCKLAGDDIVGAFIKSSGHMVKDVNFRLYLLFSRSKENLLHKVINDTQGDAEAINLNEYNRSPLRFRMGKILQMQLRNTTCFDFEYYRLHSPDLPADKDQLWQHFVTSGQFSGRKFRFLCSSPLHEEAVVEKLIAWQLGKILDF